MDRSTYLGKVRELLPAVRERAMECEHQRRIPEATFEEFKEAGLFRCVQPARYGGYELDPLTFFQAVSEVAEACPSTAWVLAVLAVHNWEIGLMSDQAQADVWGEDPDIQTSSAYAPTGTVELADGGFRLSGRWPFSSGCDPSDWALLGGVVPTDDGVPDVRAFLLPRSEYVIEDDWYVCGLAGTGSKVIVVEDGFVPDHRTHSFADAFNLTNPGQQVNTGPSFKLPFFMVFAFAIAAPAIGAAQGALDYHRSYIRNKITALGNDKVADDPFAQQRVAMAVTEIDAARADLNSFWQTAWAYVEADETIPMAFRAKGRWVAANIVQRCTRVVDSLYAGSGGRAIFLDNPMQRYFRDIHAMRNHAIHNPDAAALTYGFVELNPDAGSPGFLL
ncbi:MAG: flavin-dependent monooxygenase [Actinomycetia bacterium]|nr:flavin-dependent monooxygenase [Actinomycetes bacterium]